MAEFASMGGADEQAGADEENIWIAASDGDLARVQQLLAAGESVNAQDESGYSPIHAAVSYSHIELTAFLLSAGADIHLRDADGDQPIHCCEDSAMYTFLIAHGADPTAVNAEGQTLFDKCLEDENEELGAFLVTQGLGVLPDGHSASISWEDQPYGMEGDEEDEEGDGTV